MFPYLILVNIHHYRLRKNNPAEHTGYGTKFKKQGNLLSFHFHDRCSCGRSAPETELVEVFAAAARVSFRGL